MRQADTQDPETDAARAPLVNRYQIAALTGALFNAGLMLLVPPFDYRSTLAGGEPAFYAFLPVFFKEASLIINREILQLELIAVAINACIAFLLLMGTPADRGTPRIEPRRVVFILAALNLAVVFLFPPMASLAMLGREPVATFYGFDFVLTAGARSAVFVPILYLEVVLVLVNAALFWVVFGNLTRRDTRRGPRGTIYVKGASAQASVDTALAGSATPSRFAVPRRPKRDG